MNKWGWIFVVALLVRFAQADVVTNFYVDFSNSSDGVATAANLNNGTAVGTWTATTPLDSVVTGGALDAGVGLYAYQLTLAQDAVVSGNTTTFYMDFQASAAYSASYGGAFSAFKLQDENGDVMISFRTPLGGDLQWFNSEANGWTVIAAGNAGTNADAPDNFNSLNVVLTDAGFDVIYNDVVVRTGLLNRGGSALHSIVFTGETAPKVDTGLGGAAMWYDNISVTSIPEPATMGLLGFSSLALLLARRITRS